METTDLIKLLKANYVDGMFHSHVSMKSPKGKFLLNKGSIEQLWDIYSHTKSPSGLAEMPQHYYPVLVDIDIKIPEDNLDPSLLSMIKAGKSTGEHIYTPTHVVKVIEVYHSILSQIVDDCTEDHLLCCLLEKEIYQVVSNTGRVFYKNGFHLHFPNIFLSRQHQENYLNPRVKQAFTQLEIFSDLHVEDSASMFDAGIGGKPWLIYGASKEGGEPYLLTKVFDRDMVIIPVEEAFGDYQIYDNEDEQIMFEPEDVMKYLPRILSIIPYGRTTNTVRIGLDSVTKETQRLASGTRKPVRENLKATVDENLKQASKLLPMLSKTRAEEHDEWMTIGWIMFNIGDGCQEALDLWLEFSSQDEANFDEDECIRRWDKMVRKDYTIGTLKFYARSDNPEQYSTFVAEEGAKYIKASLEGSHHDIAKLLFAEYGTEFACSSVASRTWYQFVGNFWEEIEEGVFLRNRISTEIVLKYSKLGQDMFTKMTLGEDDKSAQVLLKQIQKLIIQLKSTPFKKHVMSEAADVFYNPTFKIKMDTNPNLFAFKNGVYDLKTNTFRQGRPEDFLSNHAPIDYEEMTPNDPRVLEVHDFLVKVFPDTSVRNYFLDQSSDIFVGGNHQKVVLFWTGEEGDNGKSVTQTFFEKMLGTMAIKFSTTLITGKKTQTGAAGPELARAGGGVRLGVLEEPDIDEQINAGLFKSLSGNDTYWARDLFEKGKSTREITPLFKLIFICNGLPRFRHADNAVWNRVRVIPFETTFVRNMKDCPDVFEEQLRQKRFPMDTQFSRKIPGMVPAFAWVLIEHRKSIIGKERIEPEKVRMATAMYRKQNDIYRQYIEERIILEGGKVVRLEDLYEDFKEWYRASFPSSIVPPKNTVKEYFNKTWGETHAGLRWIGYRIRVVDDDLKDCATGNGDIVVDDDEEFTLPM